MTAAGSGTRLGFGVPKALVEVNGQTILALALERLPQLDGLVISAPASHLEVFREIASQIRNLGHYSPEMFVEVVSGGDSRQGSVACALAALDERAAPVQDDDLVVVHDAARCLTPTAVFDRVFNALESGAEAVIPAQPVADTIKIATGDYVTQENLAITAKYGSDGQNPPSCVKDGSSNPNLSTSESAKKPEFVESTLDRARLRAVQTPQGFRLKSLLELHTNFAARAADESQAFGDDAGMAEEAGITVGIVPGDDLAFKITRPLDLQFATCLLTP